MTRRETNVLFRRSNIQTRLSLLTLVQYFFLPSLIEKRRKFNLHISIQIPFYIMIGFWRLSTLFMLVFLVGIFSFYGFSAIHLQNTSDKNKITSFSSTAEEEFASVKRRSESRILQSAEAFFCPQPNEEPIVVNGE